LESAGRTLVCSVLFSDIADYSQKPVAEQLQLKQAFNQALAVALEHIAARDRIILDTGDGAAITFMGDPEDALFASMAMRDLSATVPVRLGVNLGPVRLVKDLNGQMNIIGDGINVAQRVMSFSRPGQLLVSRSFYEVVSCLSRDYANLFRHEGSRTDKHVRAHEVYAVVGATPAPRRVDEAEARSESTPPGAVGWFSGSGPLGLRRTALVVAPIVFMLIIAGGVGARAMLPESAPVKATTPKPAAAATHPPVQRAPAPQGPPPSRRSNPPLEAAPPSSNKRRRRSSWRRAPRASKRRSRSRHRAPAPPAASSWRSHLGARCWSTARAGASARRFAFWNSPQVATRWKSVTPPSRRMSPRWT
jgi:class 3 adenylate cyclase